MLAWSSLYTNEDELHDVVVQSTLVMHIFVWTANIVWNAQCSLHWSFGNEEGKFGFGFCMVLEVMVNRMVLVWPW